MDQPPNTDQVEAMARDPDPGPQLFPPPGHSYVDVTTLPESERLVPESRADAAANTDRLDRIIASQAKRFPERIATVFIPRGDYYFDRPIVFADCKIRVMGAGVGHTRLILINDAAGFGAADSPTPFVQTSPCGDTFNGLGNVAFDNVIEYLGVETGNNPKASGIRFSVANYGTLNNVRVRSSYDGPAAAQAGTHGLEFVSSVGPGYIKNVDVVGYDVGIFFDAKSANTLTLVEVEVRDQATVGVENLGKNVTFDRFTSTDNPTAIRLASDMAAVFLHDSVLTGRGGDAKAPAIEGTAGSYVYLKNVQVTKHSLAVAGTAVQSNQRATITEWSSLGHVTGDGVIVPPLDDANIPGAITPPALRPETRQAPEFHEASRASWYVIPDLATPDFEATGFARAIGQLTETRTSLYVPFGEYELDADVTIGGVPGKRLHKIDFGYAVIKGDSRARRIHIHDTDAPALIIENMVNGVTFVYHGSKSVVFRNIKALNILNIEVAGTGTVFIENAAVGVNVTIGPGGQAIVRGIDRGGKGDLINRGGRLWVLGDNIEINPGDRGIRFEELDARPNPQIVTLDGGLTEIIGGTYDTNYMVRTAVHGPLFVVAGPGSKLALASAGLNRESEPTHPTLPRAILDLPLQMGRWSLVIDDHGIEKRVGNYQVSRERGQEKRTVFRAYRSPGW
ncbi:MAG: hypothetical protein H7138_07350 [Myxococcales bacterium]|nr:hypothetical protein [Myxococcales bacterium]